MKYCLTSLIELALCVHITRSFIQIGVDASRHFGSQKSLSPLVVQHESRANCSVFKPPYLKVHEYA